MCESADAVDAEWRPAYEHEGVALVSRYGVCRIIEHTVIRSHGSSYPVHERICQPSWTRRGGVIRIAGKTLSLPRLVATTWLRPMTDQERVIHIDGNDRNCCVENLKIVPIYEAWHTYESSSRRLRSKAEQIQLRGELWRPIPECPLHMLSNFARVKSCAMEPPILLRTRQSSRKVLSIWITIRGKKTAFSLAKIMRRVWPELAHEYLPGKTGRKPKDATSDT